MALRRQSARFWPPLSFRGSPDGNPCLKDVRKFTRDFPHLSVAQSTVLTNTHGAELMCRTEATMAEVETYKGDAYCVKCKEKRDFEGTVKISESGRRMAQGICPVCGTKVNRILGKAQ